MLISWVTNVTSLNVELGRDTQSCLPQATAAWMMWEELLWVLRSAQNMWEATAHGKKPQSGALKLD